MTTETQWVEAPEGDVPAAPHGGTTYRVRYQAQGARAEVPMTGLVTIPASPRPDGAIVSWAHGTTGLSTSSAPSLYVEGDPIERYIPHWTRFLQGWLDAGYIVTQPDYEGLGVEEVGGTYMHRGSLASSINRLVEETAAKFSPDANWVNVGFSQGGYAALAAADAPADNPVATIAIAPGDTELVNKNLRLMGIRPVDVAKMLKGKGVRFFPIVIAGALNAFEGVSASDFLSERGAELVEKAEQVTLPELTDYVTGVSGGELFISKADTKKMQDLLDRQRLELMEPKGPILVLAGDSDTTINREAVKATIAAWQGKGVDVEYREVDDSDHNSSVNNSYPIQTEWVGQHLG